MPKKGKPEAPIRDRGKVEIRVTISRESSKGYSSGDTLASVDLGDEIVLARGEGEVEENHATFLDLLSSTVDQAKGTAIEQLGGQVEALKADREKREAKEAAQRELEAD